MSVAVNGIAHIQLTVNDPDRCIPFWEKLCHFLEMKTLIKGDDIIYCIGSRTGILIRAAPPEKREAAHYDQDHGGSAPLLLPRARATPTSTRSTASRSVELGARVVHPPEEGSQFAPGYYSVLFEDPDGIRVEVNHVPGQGHLGKGGRLGPGGEGPNDHLPS